MKNIGKREVVSLMDDNKVEPDPLPNWASDESPVTELEALRITALLQDETIVNMRRLLWRAKQSRRRLVGHIVRLRKDRALGNAVIEQIRDGYNAAAKRANRNGDALATAYQHIDLLIEAGSVMEAKLVIPDDHDRTARALSEWGRAVALARYFLQEQK